MMNKHLLIVMGVSGCGKSTLAKCLAATLQHPMIEADDFHTVAAKTRMQAGTGLSEQEREPWLNRVVAACKTQLAQSSCVVVACSALKLAHRNRFRDINAKVLFLWPDVPVSELRQRLENRKEHFASAQLLTSQFATFEPPTNENDCIRIKGSQNIESQLVRSLEVVHANIS